MTGLAAQMHEEQSSTEQSSSISVLERPDEQTQERTDAYDGDADMFAHIVPAERLRRSRLRGTPVIALCGKVWFPKRSGVDYPICKECKEIYDQLTGGQRI